MNKLTILDIAHLLEDGAGEKVTLHFQFTFDYTAEP